MTVETRVKVVMSCGLETRTLRSRVVKFANIATTVLLLMGCGCVLAQVQSKPGRLIAPAGPLQIGKITDAPVRLEGQSLTITPVNPRAGDQVTVRFIVKNTGTGTVPKVPWAIHLASGNQTLKQGEHSNLAPGETFEGQVGWTAVEGEQLLQGYIDSTGKALKNTAPISAKILRLTIAVAPPPPPPVKLVTQVLHYEKARQAGALFQIAPMPLCQAAQFAPTPSTAPDFADFSIIFQFACFGSAGAFAKTEVESFKNMRLKNGWKIKEIIEHGGQITPIAFHAWITRPSAGSDDPFMKSRFEAGFTNIAGSAPTFVKGVKVIIEGLENTSPY